MIMQFTAQQIAQVLGGTIEGNAEATVSTFANITEGHEGAISFLYDRAYLPALATTRSTIVLLSADIEAAAPAGVTLVRVANAREAVGRLMAIYESMKPQPKGVSPQAYIDPSAQVGADCYIGPFAYVGEGVKIGDGARIYPHATILHGTTVGAGTIVYPNVTIYHECHIGARCIIHAGAVIGADGFGFQPTAEGYEKIPQIGNVVVEDDVEIGANTCVDRSMMGTTRVCRGVKLDNLVQIAHNDVIGEHTVMSAQVGLAGTTEVGPWCMFGGQVGIAGHCQIAPRTQVGAQAGIAGGVKQEGQTLQGSPAIDARRFWRASVVYKQLPELSRTVNELKRELEALKQK